jgi:energy-coupling factor transporter ATP-binding protein EcfA2
MPAPIEDQVIDFFHELFNSIFAEPFLDSISDRRRRNAVMREIEEASDAASGTLIRMLQNQQLSDQQASDIIDGLVPILRPLELDVVSNANMTPESIVAEVLGDVSVPRKVSDAGNESVFGLALSSIVQTLSLIGPVMSEWRKLSFASTFEMVRRVSNRLNQISEQMDILARSGREAADQRYELTYRDHLLQRFHRVEAGTVRMASNVSVDLGELFVMPDVKPRKRQQDSQTVESDGLSLMDLAEARKLLGNVGAFGTTPSRETQNDRESVSALEHIKRESLTVIVGAPGSGKSTLLEWLQVRVANAEQEMVMAGEQAIPVLLRIRQLDPHDLPHGADVIAKATASSNITRLAPQGWMDRQMNQGRVLFMVDGLDETEPHLRDQHVLPWLLDLVRIYPRCRFIVSSRPVGYPAGALTKYGFTECDLLDFTPDQVSEYTKRWCTSVLLAQNQPEDEARREGETDGQQIVSGFTDNPYINDLARNPLMLSAICLVNYFEGGRLPEDRATLYKLCVEGLIHNWDQRRGIHSDFTLEEKLRVCREVALAMQADDRAEYEAGQVLSVFNRVLDDSESASRLLEHIRFRTGLLLERRPGIYAFAHLTFQEYLAALAIYEGNQLNIAPDRLVDELDDGRWREVISLYCGLAPARVARDMIHSIMGLEDSENLGGVLADAYLSSGSELALDSALRASVVECVAGASSTYPSGLERFPDEIVAPIANRTVGRRRNTDGLSGAYSWLVTHSESIDWKQFGAKFGDWIERTPFQLCELMHLAHRYGPGSLLVDLANNDGMYSSPGPQFGTTEIYPIQACIAYLGIVDRISLTSGPEQDALANTATTAINALILLDYPSLSRMYLAAFPVEVRPTLSGAWSGVPPLLRELSGRIRQRQPRPGVETTLDTARQVEEFAKNIEQAITDK